MRFQQVSIHVFRQTERGVQYLITRRRPREEFDWGVAQTSLRPVETLSDAAHRWMSEHWRAPPPRPWVDLRCCAAYNVGDLDLLQWAVGYGVSREWSPEVESRASLGGFIEARWVALIEAFRLLKEDSRRQALFRLHTAVGQAG